MTTSVIVAGARTPVGKLMGSLKDFSGTDLGAIAISGALERAKVPPSLVEYVIMGQILTAGAGQMPARRGGRGHRLGRAFADHQQDVPDRPQCNCHG
jgi:acetyl-CoA C-acetyltransferase